MTKEKKLRMEDSNGYVRILKQCKWLRDDEDCVAFPALKERSCCVAWITWNLTERIDEKIMDFCQDPQFKDRWPGSGRQE